MTGYAPSSSQQWPVFTASTAAPPGLSGEWGWSRYAIENATARGLSVSVMCVAEKRPHSSQAKHYRPGRQPREVEMPSVSWGQCRIRRCWVVGDLADGLCITHWDRGFDYLSRHDDKD